MEEANIFIKLLNKCFSKDEYELVINEIYSKKSKLVTVYLVIELKNEFFLKVLKKNNLYHIEFVACETDFDKIDSFKNRDSFFDFFDILCEKYSDLSFDFDAYYPPNFESTEYFKEYYEYSEDKKGVRSYGLKPDNAIRFIKDNFDFIVAVVTKTE